MFKLTKHLNHLIPFIYMLFIVTSYAKNDKPQFQSQYLGQKPPGLVPEIFAPDLFSGKYRLHGFPTFSPDGKEIYWPILPPKIMFMKYENNSWSNPAEAAFSENNTQAPCFSPDGNRIFYQVSRNGGYGSLDIWYVEKVDTGWSHPKNIGQPINSSKLESQPSFTRDGTIYFTGELEGVMFNRGIYKAQYVNRKYVTPELLGANINTQYLDIYPFIALDESYLLFCSTRPSMDEKKRRIFISFRLKNGTWSEPINFNKKINFDVQSTYPYVSPDGRYIFFTAKGSMHWMSAEIIDQLRPREN